MFKTGCLLIMLSLSLFLVSCGSDSEVEGAAKGLVTTTYITMPANTAIIVTLTDSIDTDVQITGSTFRAALTKPIVVDGKTLFPAGSQAKGMLNNVVESGHLKTPAELNYSLTTIQNANGEWVTVGTNQINHTMGSHTDKEVAMIGGGALVGGVIGKLINRKGSTEIGILTGAAAGTGLAVATGKQDIFYGVGTEVTFYSNKSIQVALK